jgi:hypothetical protein
MYDRPSTNEAGYGSAADSITLQAPRDRMTLTFTRPRAIDLPEAHLDQVEALP